MNILYVKSSTNSGGLSTWLEIFKYYISLEGYINLEITKPDEIGYFTDKDLTIIESPILNDTYVVNRLFHANKRKVIINIHSTEDVLSEEIFPNTVIPYLIKYKEEFESIEIAVYRPMYEQLLKEGVKKYGLSLDDFVFKPMPYMLPIHWSGAVDFYNKSGYYWCGRPHDRYKHFTRLLMMDYLTLEKYDVSLVYDFSQVKRSYPESKILCNEHTTREAVKMNGITHINFSSTAVPKLSRFKYFINLSEYRDLYDLPFEWTTAEAIIRKQVVILPESVAKKYNELDSHFIFLTIPDGLRCQKIEKLPEVEMEMYQYIVENNYNALISIKNKIIKSLRNYLHIEEGDKFYEKIN